MFKWGSPKYLITDNGTEFANKLITEKLKELGVTQTLIAPYHAQANPVERVNRTLKTMISIFVKNDHRDWDVHLQEFAFALNASVHASTKMSPYFLNLGGDPKVTHAFNHPQSPSTSWCTKTWEMRTPNRLNSITKIDVKLILK